MLSTTRYLTISPQVSMCNQQRAYKSRATKPRFNWHQVLYMVSKCSHVTLQAIYSNRKRLSFKQRRFQTNQYSRLPLLLTVTSQSLGQSHGTVALLLLATRSGSCRGTVLLSLSLSRCAMDHYHRSQQLYHARSLVRALQLRLTITSGAPVSMQQYPQRISKELL